MNICHVDDRSTTPTGTPPKNFISLNESNGNSRTPADTSRILKALADMAKTNTTATGTPAQTNTSNVPIFQNAYMQSMPSSVNSAPSVPPAQAVNIPGVANGANPFAGMMSSVPNFGEPQGVSNGQTSMPANPLMQQGQGTTPAALQQQVQLLQLLQSQGVPQDQWAPLLAVLMQAGGAGGAAQPAGFGGYGRDDPSRDRNGYNNPYSMRSPSGRNREHRSRSRSPGGYARRRDGSPSRRRDSPMYGDYGRDGRSHAGSGRGGGGGRNDYRQRSPDNRYSRRSDSPRRQDQQILPPPGPKHIDYDHSLPSNNIKGMFARN